MHRYRTNPLETIIRQLGDAEQCAQGIPPNSDIYFSHFRIPLTDLKIQGELTHGQAILLDAAMGSYHNQAAIAVMGDYLYVNLPGKHESVPVQSILAAFHKLRFELLKATHQRPDGLYVIDKAKLLQTLPGMCYVDLERLLCTLASEKHGIGNPAIHAQSFYQLPKGVVVVDANGLRHTGAVPDNIFGTFVQNQSAQGNIHFSAREAETHTVISNAVLQTLTQTLGEVPPTCGRGH